MLLNSSKSSRKIPISNTVSCYTFSVVVRCPRKEFEISYQCAKRLKKASEWFDRFINWVIKLEVLENETAPGN